MRGRARRAGLLAALAALVVSTAALATTSVAPIGKFSSTLTLSRWAGDPWEGATRDAAKTWGTATGATLNIDALPYENLHDKHVLQFSSHSGAYDIVYTHPSWFGEYVRAGYLRPIDGYLRNPNLNPRGFSAANTYIPSIFSQGKLGGKQYCFQDFVATVLLAYRKDVLAKAKITPPRTWAEVLAAAQKLNRKNGMAGIALPAKRTGATADVLSTLLIGAGTSHPA